MVEPAPNGLPLQVRPAVRHQPVPAAVGRLRDATHTWPVESFMTPFTLWYHSA